MLLQSLTLTRAFFSFIAVGIALFAMLMTWLVLDRTRTYEVDALETAVGVRTRAAAHDFGRALGADWLSLDHIGERMTTTGLENLRPMLDAATGDRVSWAGFTGLDGTVLAASNGMHEGANFGAQPWFQRGLESDFAGDVHGAVLLSELLGATEAEPIRFIDLARPVTDHNGDPLGVIGFRIGFAWAKRFLRESADALEMELYLISGDGEIIIATDGTDAERLNLPSMRAATGAKTWPDGKQYYTATIPQVVSGEMPSLGWRMMGRIGTGAVTGGRTVVAGIVSTGLAVGTGLVLLLAVTFSKLFLVPFRMLAQTAEDIADGAEVYPYESRCTAEARRLSAALMRLQSRFEK
jgi:hypothetical protein